MLQAEVNSWEGTNKKVLGWCDTFRATSLLGWRPVSQIPLNYVHTCSSIKVLMEHKHHIPTVLRPPCFSRVCGNCISSPVSRFCCTVSRSLVNFAQIQPLVPNVLEFFRFSNTPRGTLRAQVSWEVLAFTSWWHTRYRDPSPNANFKHSQISICNQFCQPRSRVIYLRFLLWAGLITERASGFCTKRRTTLGSGCTHIQNQLTNAVSLATFYIIILCITFKCYKVFLFSEGTWNLIWAVLSVKNGRWFS
jgi:hypothetical protein